MKNERRTNINVDELAGSRLVRQFMHRIATEQKVATGRHALIVDVAIAAAQAFDLYYDDGRTMARKLLDVAAQVVALELACAGVEQRRDSGRPVAA